MKNIILVLSIAGAAFAHASPTGLASIPVADILRHREASFAYGVAGTERNIDRRYAHALGTTIGLFDRVEIGSAHDFLGGNTWDVKVLLHEDMHCAVSAGAMNCQDEHHDLYAVGRLDFQNWRLHAGIGRFDNVAVGMVGFDYGINDAWVLMADYTGSRDGYKTIALDWAAMEGLHATFTVGLPNEKTNGVTHAVGLTYSLKF